MTVVNFITDSYQYVMTYVGIFLDVFSIKRRNGKQVLSVSYKVYAQPTYVDKHWCYCTSYEKTKNTYLSTQPSHKPKLVKTVIKIWCRNPKYYPLYSKKQFTTFFNNKQHHNETIILLQGKYHGFLSFKQWF